jgi:hypothetical protein
LAAKPEFSYGAVQTEPSHDPKARGVSALVYGEFKTAAKIYVFESQWDAIALIDVLHLFDEIDAGEVCLITTRGRRAPQEISAFPLAAEFKQ